MSAPVRQGKALDVVSWAVLILAAAWFGGQAVGLVIADLVVRFGGGR